MAYFTWPWIFVAQALNGPWGLAVPMMLASFCFGLSRPSSNNLILEQVDSHAGSASSPMVFFNFSVGAFAMWLIALNWADKIVTMGLIGMLSAGLILIVWLLIGRFYFDKGHSSAL